jgi:hypothetical protein
MEILLALALLFAEGLPDLPVLDLSLTIEEDRGFSGDHSTLCLVRVVNRGRSTLAGGDIAFEALAYRDGRVAARQRGRFGLTLGPHETMETRVAFLGKFDRFAVELADPGRGRKSGARRKSGSGSASGTSKRRSPSRGKSGRNGLE